MFAVKSFRMSEGNAVKEGLPYRDELVEASEKIDVWALGVMAYQLLAGQTLVPVTRDDDCSNGA